MISRVIQLRKQKGLNQEKFAERIGLSRNFINQVENGNKNFSDRTISDICREFNVNEHWLRSGEGDMFNLPEDETAALVSELLEETNPTYNLVLNIIKTYRDLDEASQDILDDFILKLSKNMQKEKED